MDGEQQGNTRADKNGSQVAFSGTGELQEGFSCDGAP